MPPKASGKGRKKVVQEKASEKNIEAYFSPSKKIPDQTIENEKNLNGKVEKDNNEKTEEIVKPVTKQAKKRGKVETVENGKVEAEELKKNEETAEPVAKQGRKKAVVYNNSDSTTKVVSNSLQADNVAAVPLKRGKKKILGEIDDVTESKLKEENKKKIAVNGEGLNTLDDKEPVENTEKIENKTEANEDQTKITGKRGRKKAIVPISDETIVIQKSIDSQTGLNTLDDKEPVENAEKIENKTEANEVQTKITAKRGRKKAPVPISEETIVVQKNIDSQTEEIEGETKTNEVQTKITAKRGRKKATVPISDETVLIQKSADSHTKDKSESSKIDKPDSKTVLSKPKSKVTKSSAKLHVEESGENNETDAKEEEEVSAVPVKVNRKRKNVNVPPQRETKRNKAVEKKTSDMDTVDENKILRVSLQRSKSLDDLASDKITEKGKEAEKKPATKGKRAKPYDTGTSGDGMKPVKKLKEETKSKGQSKKDKMPDVTVLDFSNTSMSPAGKAWNLKLSSWNVNGVRAWLEKDGLVYLKHESPDIMCIQETKCSEDKLPAEVNVDGYHSYWLAGDKDGYSGVGLLSKDKPLSVKYGIDNKEHDSEGRVITAEYEGFFLISAYVPNAGRGLVRLDYRMQWDKDFCSYIKSLDESKPVILCGDLNVAHEEIDLANPKTNKKNAGFTKEEREGFSTLLSEGFIDTFRHLYPDQKAAYTFWTYMMNARAKNVGWRLDYFVVSKRLTDNLCDNVIRKDVFGSDHCPIVLFISI